MVLQSSLLKEFARITNDRLDDNSTKYLYGVVTIDTDESGNPTDKYVILDGSNIKTPVFNTMGVEDGDRVLVMMKDRRATIVGNETNPSGVSEDLINSGIMKVIKDPESGIATVIFDRIEANEIVTKILMADEAIINSLQTKLITTDILDANEIVTKILSADKAWIDNATIADGIIENALIDLAIIKKSTTDEAHVTKFLDAVEINANQITAGTLAVDRLLIKVPGTENDYKFITFDDAGELKYTTMDGSAITKRTITADHIVAHSLTADEIDVTSLTASDAFIDSLKSTEIIVEAKNTSEIVNAWRVEGTTKINGGMIDTSTLVTKNIIVQDLSENILFSAITHDTNEPYVTIASWKISQTAMTTTNGSTSFVMNDTTGITLTTSGNGNSISLIGPAVQIDSQDVIINNAHFIINNDNDTISASRYAQGISISDAKNNQVAILMREERREGSMGYAISSTEFYSKSTIESFIKKRIVLYGQPYDWNAPNIVSVNYISVSSYDVPLHKTKSSRWKFGAIYEFAILTLSKDVNSKFYNNGALVSTDIYTPPDSNVNFEVDKTGRMIAHGSGTHQFGNSIIDDTVMASVRNDTGHIAIGIGKSGNAGLYDIANNRWILVKNFTNKTLVVHDPDSNVARKIGASYISNESGNRPNIPTVGAIYDALPTINGNKTSTTAYAPTTVGLKGYMATSNGTGTPGWKLPVGLIDKTISEISISANSYKNATVTVTATDGYEIIGVDSWGISNGSGGSNSNKCALATLKVTERGATAKVNYQINNLGSSAAKVDLYFRCLQRPLTT